MTGRNWQCRLGMHHWVLQHEPDTGSTYHECSRCGKERSPDGPSVPPIVGG
jgi:hypothetical protein